MSFFLSSNKPTAVKINDSFIKSSKGKNFFDVNLHSNLLLGNHITDLIVRQVKRWLSIVASYMTFDKKRTLLKAFVLSQFNYGLLV